MNWVEKDNGLHREVRTTDFVSAYNLVSAILGPAEAMNHHPDLAFGWGYLRITLTSHDAGKVTERDRRLAQAIDEALAPFGV